MPAPRPLLAINLVQLLPGVSGGIETYARELIPRIIERLEGWQIAVIVNDEGMQSVGAWSDRIELVPAGFSWHSRAHRLLYESSVGSLRARRMRPTLIHNMVNTAFAAPGAPQVTTVFDATQLLEPAASRAMAVFRHLLRAAPNRSDLTLTISESAAVDISGACKVDPERLRVVHLAARRPHEPAPRAELAKLGIPDGAQYIVTPAARRPNKNIAGLLRAYGLLAADTAPLLVLPGADGGNDAQLTELISRLGIADRVVFPGWVEDAELDTLYSHSLGLIFPSLMEGFGLPILEAMQCGCPVATSDRSSMPEIADEAAIYFDPTDDRAIAAAIERLTADRGLRDRLAAAGRKRAAEFDWNTTADATVAAYEEVTR